MKYYKVTQGLHCDYRGPHYTADNTTMAVHEPYYR